MTRRLILIFGVLFVGLIALRLAKGGHHDGVPGPLDASFVSGGSLTMDLSAGNYHIRPTDNDHVTVTFTDNITDARRGSIYFDASKSPAALEVDIPGKSRSVDIGVPRKTNIQINLTAGNLHLSGIEGSKDVQCNAGNLQIEVGEKEQYGPVYLSVASGNIQARPWNAHRSGLFRSFNTTGQGKYGLRVHADAGNIVVSAQ